MSVLFRPLNKAAELVEASGLEVTYAYDDLVFAEHSVFILKFDDVNDKNFHLYFNIDCPAADKDQIFSLLSTKAAEMNVFIIQDGTFKMASNEQTEEIEILFNEMI